MIKLVLEKYLEDYYKGLLTNKDMASKEGIEEHKIAKMLRSNGYKTYQDVLNDLDFSNKKLKSLMIQKYNDLKGRCLGSPSSDKYQHYKGKEYLTIIEWVKLCNKNKQLLENLWETFINSEKNLKYALSTDRINNDGAYLINNIQFVTNGFNSWKSTLNPIKILYNGNTSYHMSCQEGSRYFNIRQQTIGECLNKKQYCKKEYIVNKSDIKTVLKNQKCETIEIYYKIYIR